MPSPYAFTDYPLRIVPSDDDGRRWPCPCHVEPTVLLFIVPVGGGRYYVAPLQMSHLAIHPDVSRAAVVNMMDSIEWGLADA